MTRAKLLRAKHWLSILQIGEVWAPELSLEPNELRRALVEAAIGGEFDGLPDGHGLCWADPEVYSTSGAAIRTRLAVGDVNVNGSNWLSWAVRSELLVLHQDAILAFAAKRELPPPSWLGGTPEMPSHPPVKANSGRPEDTGYSQADASIIAKMHELLQSGSATSVTNAAWQVIGRDGAGAAGAGQPESKVRRLVDGYKKMEKNRI